MRPLHRFLFVASAVVTGMTAWLVAAGIANLFDVDRRAVVTLIAGLTLTLAALLMAGTAICERD